MALLRFGKEGRKLEGNKNLKTKTRKRKKIKTEETLARSSKI